MKNNGQSLVEFIIVIPLFFILLSGLVSIFYLQRRHFMDMESVISLSLSQFLFTKEEREIAKWHEFLQESQTALTSILDKSLSPELGFKQKTTKKEHFFLEKGQGQFQMSTTADKNGYEKIGFSFQNVLDKFPLSRFQSTASSIYYPFDELAWPNRSSLATKASREFMFSLKGVSFSQNVASLSIPRDDSLFNGKCFMEPFAPQCLLPPYAGKMNRAARDGANAQLFACHAEMVIACAQTAELMPVCISEGIGEIKMSLEMGTPARNCPLVNKEVDAFSTFVKGKALSDSVVNSILEANFRKKFL